ncbi:hypothetical protein MG293_020853 [Ovis ammon polii]|uniref:Uncharacterized protein n=1 Tax=Ovis ammon polii TaxID=230172 RepID=A0AAD4XZ63_OVIAM|nr:hypothetical protein MG293_020853 [Ovis ammon polii]KAI4550032.1 hypothetical protein MJT46_019181 [Ovis ammon polii x Ovis aries]
MVFGHRLVTASLASAFSRDHVDLDLGECGLMNSQLTAFLPSLSTCSQLTTFRFCGNPISMAMLESLLHHTVGLSKLSLMLYPAPIESYEDVHSNLHLSLLV